MRFENILIETKNKMSVITINRPNKLNALNILTINELHQALKLLSNNDDCKVIIITGSGEKAFVAGADISEFYKFSKKRDIDLHKKGQDKCFLILLKITQACYCRYQWLCFRWRIRIGNGLSYQNSSENT